MPPRVDTKNVKKPSIRKVLYKTIQVRVFTKDPNHLPEGAELTPMTSALAKTILGWTQPEKGQKFEDYLLKDRNKVTTVCSNNDGNRPFYYSLCLTYMHEILAGRWLMNGETMTIGNTGILLDAQHRLIALVLAAQEWTNNPDKYPFWSSEPTIDCIVVFGVEESIVTKNTINVGKARSLGDALYAAKLFKGPKNLVAKKAKIAEYAVRMLWMRTGAYDLCFSTKPSHAQSIEFVLRHPTLFKIVEEVFALDTKTGGKLSQHLSLGYISGLTYLMAVDPADAKTYYEQDLPSEEGLRMTYLPGALRFLKEIAEHSKTVAPLRQALGELYEDGGTLGERIGLFVAGWNLWSHGNAMEITTKVKLDYADTGEGRVLINQPLLAGIDLGPK